MYLNILKKDLKRKKTMNIIVFIFIIMASAFISSSVNNLISISTAMDNYIEKSNLPDYSAFVANEYSDKLDEFILQNDSIQSEIKNNITLLDQTNIKLNGKKISYVNPILAGNIDEPGYFIYNRNNENISSVKKGNILLTTELARSIGAKYGDIITVTNNDFAIDLIYSESSKDIIFSSGMMGVTKFLLNNEDYNNLMSESELPSIIYIGYYTNNVELLENEFMKLGISAMLSGTKQLIKTTYTMDMVTAGTMLIVSVCLVLISIVILRFTIVFTLSEEFREIGVMKAIGIKNHKIRSLYIIKYLAISTIGAAIGFLIGIPFGNMLIKQVSENIVMSNSENYMINILCCVSVVFIVIGFCYMCTGKLKHFSAIDAIKNGSTGERYKKKSVLRLHKSNISSVPFMAVNDILSGLKNYIVLIIVFTIGIILVIIPINAINTLTSDKIVTWFSMVEADVFIVEETFLNVSSIDPHETKKRISDIKQNLTANNIPCKVFQETGYAFAISKGDKSSNGMSMQGTGISTDQYSYLAGTAPQNKSEVAITHLTADKIDAKIGDIIKINSGDKNQEVMVTAIYQSMVNMGYGARFHEDFILDDKNAVSKTAIQVKFTDEPSKSEVRRRIQIIKELYPNEKIQTGGVYASEMIGGTAEILISVKNFIVFMILVINILVTVLMVKSFITKETGEIGMLKAIGFRNNAIIHWQTFRIAIILIISTFLGAILSNPITKFSLNGVFEMMGANNMKFAINPLEVYIIYPLLIFTVTVFASFITSQQIRKISASETSNIE